jgi:hypothetical protein
MGHRGEGLGADFNYIHIADSVVIPMKDYGAATVFVYEASAEAVISVQRSLNGGSPVAIPNLITTYYTSTGAGGAWAKQTQTANDEVTKSSAAAQSIAAIHIPATFITADGGDYNELNIEVDGSAVVSVILHDLHVQRAPQNLPAIV